MKIKKTKIQNFQKATSCKLQAADGFTVIEAIFYTAIVGTIGAVLIVVTLNSLKAYNKSQAEQNVFNNVSGGLGAIIDEIKYAKSVYLPTSFLDINSGQLSLETELNIPAGENSAFVDFYLDNGRIYEKRDGAAANPITSERVFVEVLRFSLATTGGRDSVTVQTSGRINTQSVKPEDQARLTLNSTAALRGAY